MCHFLMRPVICLDVLRALKGGIGGELARHGDGLSPGDEGHDQHEEADQEYGQPGGKSKPFGDLDRFPGLELGRGRQIVDGHFVQAGALGDQRAKSRLEPFTNTLHVTSPGHGRS